MVVHLLVRNEEDDQILQLAILSYAIKAEMPPQMDVAQWRLYVGLDGMG